MIKGELSRVLSSNYCVNPGQTITTSLNNRPYFPENYDDSEVEHKQLQTNHETDPSVIKQSLKYSMFVPSLFKYWSKFNEIFIHPDTPLNRETVPKYQERYCSEICISVDHQKTFFDKNTYLYCLSTLARIL